MTIYIPTSSAPAAQTLSESLWGLTMPPSVINGNATRLLFGTVTMKNASVWLACDDEITIPVHQDANVDPIAEILEPFVDSGVIDYPDIQALFDLVEITRGQELNVWQAFPQYWKDMGKTLAELQTLNLWPV